jgi:hypothetical protein
VMTMAVAQGCPGEVGEVQRGHAFARRYWVLLMVPSRASSAPTGSRSAIAIRVHAIPVGAALARDGVLGSERRFALHSNTKNDRKISAGSLQTSLIRASRLFHDEDETDSVCWFEIHSIAKSYAGLSFVTVDGGPRER